MRFCAFVTIVLLAGTAGLRAQTNPSSTNAAPAKPVAAAAENKALAILSPEQISEYAAARKKALADNPTLNSENESLKAEYADVMLHGTAVQKQAVLEKVDSHRQKLRAAMLKEDPNLDPIFKRIDTSMSEMKAKGAAPSN
jgi:hypothetical protein